MPHRLQHISELIALALSTITALTGRVLIAETPGSPQAEGELTWLLLPLIGALLATTAALMLNPEPEIRRLVVGRSIFGVVMGVCAPQIVVILRPGLATISLHPGALVLGGFLITLIGYVLARPLVEYLYRRSRSAAEDIGDDLLNRVPGLKPREETKP